MQTRPVYRTLNKPMTLLGVERKLFFFILTTSFAMFQMSTALMPSLVMFGLLWCFARVVTQADPQLLRILLNSGRYAARYDPAKSEGEGDA